MSDTFTNFSGTAAPMMRINIDTDAIIPGRFLVRTTEDGLGAGLFWNLAHHPDGTINEDFILNKEPFDKAAILLADRNFGCGSSREAAPRALSQRGFRAVIAPSFSGIFFNNCFRNNFLPVALPEEVVRKLVAETEANPLSEISVNLDTQTVTSSTGETYSFDVPPRLRQMLLEGLDEIDLTLTRRAEIDAFRAKDRVERPWAYEPGWSA
jgi:3-isopropylmalate/(R)-2-methylmalate dehydratase small subunit